MYLKHVNGSRNNPADALSLFRRQDIVGRISDLPVALSLYSEIWEGNHDKQVRQGRHDCSLDYLRRYEAGILF